ncbi:MAG: spermidine synthase, partial [Pseudomonadota bacterium]
MTGFGVARRGAASLVLMAASGFAGLGYQIVWTQQSALWLGHESAAVLAVVAAFFGGLAVGAFVLGQRVARSARPARWYAGCELAVGLWSLVLVFAMHPWSALALRLTGVQPTAGWQWVVAFVGTFVLLLPATAAMGATLPAMERATAGDDGHHSRSIAPLYASNTLGAVVGVLAAAFWLVPRLGLARTAGVGIALNLACAASALLLFPAASGVARVPLSATAETKAAGGLLGRLTLTGLLGIGFEVLVVRVLSQVTEDTVYTFAMLLAVYLVGTAAGAAAYKRWLDGPGDRPESADWLLGALAGACLIGTATLWGAAALRQATLRFLGGGFNAAVAAEAALAVVAFGPATLVMGALFSHLGDRARAAGVGF